MSFPAPPRSCKSWKAWTPRLVEGWRRPCPKFRVEGRRLFILAAQTYCPHPEQGVKVEPAQGHVAFSGFTRLIPGGSRDELGLRARRGEMSLRASPTPARLLAEARWLILGVLYLWVDLPQGAGCPQHGALGWKPLPRQSGVQAGWGSTLGGYPVVRRRSSRARPRARSAGV